MKSKFPVFDTILLLLIVIEQVFLNFTYSAGWLSQDANSTAYVLSSILFGCVFLYKFTNTPFTVPVSSLKPFHSFFLPGLLVVGGLAFIIAGYNNYFKQNPIDVRFSDIIPLIEIACKRLLNGQYPYELVKDFGYDMDMTYLPAQWAPFLSGIAFHFDVRWVSIFAIAIASAILCYRAFCKTRGAVNYLTAILLVAAHVILLTTQPNIAAFTVELLISAYYIWLISSLNSNSIIAHIITLSLCLLSRFSLALWMPLYFFVFFVNKENKKAVYTGLGIMAIILATYVIPFLSKDPMIFIKAYTYYDKGSEHEWTTSGSGNKPTVLFSGIGFAYAIYYNFRHLNVIEQINLAKKIHMVACLATTGILSAWYWRYKNAIDKRLFLMGSLKIYMAIFLFFVQIPYLYLMCVGNFISIAVFIEQTRYRIAGSVQV